MNMLKTIASVILRMVLFMPLTFLAHLFDGLRMLFERLSDGFFDMAKATRQLTMAPYVRDVQKALELAKKRDLEILLKSLE